MAEKKSSDSRRAKAHPSSKGLNRPLKRKRHETDLAELESQVSALEASSNASFLRFAELPLSESTLSGLEAGNFTTLTDIQRQAIPLALQGQDVLGAAKTGSGKTLAFLVPVLENLLRKQWNEHDGLGALILSPTRELAIQIFQVLRKVGRYHAFSAGLVIGGKNLREERERLGRMNILVCTPGRMLQHLDQTALFESTALQMLVLDEADRILDMGFQSTVDAIVEHLPRERQTLLFSATQTRRVSDLARLSLRDPEYVSVHEAAMAATPSGLQQNYVVVPLADKLDALWGFLRNNVKKKIIVFFSSGKQVRFAYQSFRRLQPGIPLMHLHGRQKQGGRLDVVSKFAAAQHVCLFSTDLAARGLDFPAVDWVLQADCPEDADTYIHRVGRTARYEKSGNAVLFLDPSEVEGFLKRSKQKKVPIEEIRIRTKKQESIKGKLQKLCFDDPELKYLGQKAFVSYARSIHTQHDKEVFNLRNLSMEEYAASLGLPGTPHIKFQSGVDAKRLKNAPRMPVSSDSEENGESSGKGLPRTKYDRVFERLNQDVLAPHYSNLLEDNATDAVAPMGQAGDADSEAEFLTVKRRIDDSIDLEVDSSRAAVISPGPSTKDARTVMLGANSQPLVIDSKRREKLLRSKKAMLKYRERGHKLRFDDDGNPHEIYELQDEADFRAEGDAKALRQRFIEEEDQDMRERDTADKELQKSKRQAKKERRKEMERADRQGAHGNENDDRGEGMDVELASMDDDEAIGRDLDTLDWSDTEEGEKFGRGVLANQQRNGDGGEGKKKKKWFQSSSDEDDAPQNGAKRQGKRKASHKRNGVQTLEDLEALAEQYM